MALIDDAWQKSVGPWADAICGTNGLSTDLNAVVAAGHKRIILAPGAVLTANLTLTASDGYLWSPGHGNSINLGAYYIWISGSNWHLEGFKIAGAASTLLAFTGTSQSCSIHRVRLTGASSHGLYFQTSGNDHEVTGCYIEGNVGDGIKIASGAGSCRIINNFIYNNTGWGVNDGDNSSVLIANRIAANGSGQITGTPDVYLDDDVLNKLT